MRISELVPEHPQDALRLTVVKALVGNRMRTLAKPSPALKQLHLDLKTYLEEALGRVSLSPVRNLLAHHKSRYFYQCDLKNAFPSVSAGRLAARLYMLDTNFGDISEILAFVERYCMVPELGLAQGAPASSLLFELLAEFWLDLPITKLLRKLERDGFPPVLYTRYVDDLTFSSEEEIGQHVRYKLREIIRKAGFTINDKKTSNTDRLERPVTITGGVLMPKRAPVLTGEFYNQFEKSLDRFLQGDISDQELWSLRGSMSWFHTLEVRIQGAQRNKQVRRLEDKVARAKAKLRKIFAAHPKHRFPKEWIQQLRAKVDIVAYVRKCLPYSWAPKATGIKCPCPFCGGTGSSRKARQTFTVSAKLQTFNCYKCKVHGDVIQFVRLHFKFEYQKAVKHLAAEVALPLPKKLHNKKPPT